jgi:hypothetical protein
MSPQDPELGLTQILEGWPEAPPEGLKFHNYTLT